MVLLALVQRNAIVWSILHNFGRKCCKFVEVWCLTRACMETHRFGDRDRLRALRMHHWLHRILWLLLCWLRRRDGEDQWRWLCCCGGLNLLFRRRRLLGRRRFLHDCINLCCRSCLLRCWCLWLWWLRCPLDMCGRCTAAAFHLGVELFAALEATYTERVAHYISAAALSNAIESELSARDVNTFTVSGDDARSFLRFRERHAILWAKFHAHPPLHCCSSNGLCQDQDGPDHMGTHLHCSASLSS